ncbi:MAG TPA: T9SS type A sorting domain-containing protein, partial [Candidatus Marinimicrobia bacterium]|nr:T9SS type A sorting domain-containing protein [Candidatus Neomarinimicrobiota bacterium]
GVFSGEQNVDQILQLPEGVWDLTVYSIGGAFELMPWSRTIEVLSDMQINPSFPDVSPIELNITDNNWWEVDSGTWVFSEDALLTNSSFLYGNSDSLPELSILESPWFDVSGSNRIVLEINHQYEMEWDHDSIEVSLWDSNGKIAAKVWKNQHWGEVIKDFVWVNDTSGFDSVMVQLSFGRDQTVTYRGWLVDSMKLFAGYEEYVGIHSGGGFNPIHLGSATAVYPNPSTGMIAIDLEYWREPLDIIVYNLLGQEVFREKLTGLSPQRQTWRLDLLNQRGTPLSSGVYFIRISGERKEFIRKCVFLKP